MCGVAARVQPRPKRWLWSSEAGRSRGVLLCPAEDTQDSEEVLAVRLHRHETVEGFRRIWLRDFVVTRLERSSGRYGNVSSSSRDSKGLQVDLATCLHRHETVEVFRSIWLPVFIVTRLWMSSGRSGYLSSSSRDCKGLQVDLVAFWPSRDSRMLQKDLAACLRRHETLGGLRRLWLFPSSRFCKGLRMWP